MNKELVCDVIDQKMVKVRECISALKLAKNALPANEAMLSQADITQLQSFLNVLTDSLDSAVDVACEDMAEYFQSRDA